MNYSVIGSGNMAAFLLRRLSQGGHTCAGIWGRNTQAVLSLSRDWSVNRYQSLADLHDGLDVCFLAVSDDAISEVVKQLSFRATVLVHLSGTVDVRVLAQGAQHYGVLWPVYSLLKEDLPEHNQFPIAWEAATPPARRIISQLAEEMGNSAFEAITDQRRALHLAAVFGNNFTNYIAGIAQQICSSRGLPVQLLQALLQQTYDRLQRGPAAAVQTGPARRGDTKTIEAHLEMLSEQPQWQEIYRLLSAGIQKTISK